LVCPQLVQARFISEPYRSVPAIRAISRIVSREGFSLRGATVANAEEM